MNDLLENLRATLDAGPAGPAETAAVKARARERFTVLFERGCSLLELSDEEAAKVFDTSRPNVSRWRRGLVVPPAAGLILRFLREELEARQP